MIQKSEIINFMTIYFNEHIPFNKVLGIKTSSISKEEVKLEIKMKPELVGNTYFNILHGGVTSAVLDVAGGLVATINAIERFEEMELQALQNKLTKIGTVDLRVDYLRPGKGEVFTAVGRVIRHGRKVAVTRMELHNENEEIIALGTATYLVG